MPAWKGGWRAHLEPGKVSCLHAELVTGQEVPRDAGPGMSSTTTKSAVALLSMAAMPGEASCSPLLRVEFFPPNPLPRPISVAASRTRHRSAGASAPARGLNVPPPFGRHCLCAQRQSRAWPLGRIVFLKKKKIDYFYLLAIERECQLNGLLNKCRSTSKISHELHRD